MKILAKNISDIIATEVDATNNMVKGLNFLEILKITVMEKLSSLLDGQKILFDENFEIKNEIQKNISISIKYYNEPISVSKKTIEYNSLFISYNENTSFDIYEDEVKYTSIVLYKNHGFSLPKSSVINLKCNKNVLLIEIINKTIDEILTN